MGGELAQPVGPNAANGLVPMGYDAYGLGSNLSDETGYEGYEGYMPYGYSPERGWMPEGDAGSAGEYDITTSQEAGSMYGMPNGMGGYVSPGYAECPGYMGYMGGVSPYGYPPMNIGPVKPMPPDPFIDQFSLPVALKLGTLFRWLYDPYCDPYRERCKESSSR